MSDHESPVVVRFAPSPTGTLHIGGARTALFNWLFARHHARHGAGGRFLLRIEDTDRARSTDQAVAAIIDGLTWLGLDWDGEPVSQFARAPHHAEVARGLLAEGAAYRCYCTPEELAEMREEARREGRSTRYDGRWRDRDPSEAPPNVAHTIRLKAPLEGETVIHDLIQGEVRVANRELDDMILLRADGTPTYMLAVVVDDHDMGITHVIRGDDHLTNSFRQTQLFLALGWQPPCFAHNPLIHGGDGTKLSKRHGALSIESYREAGFLPQAMRNYLLRLGWSHGDDEIIDNEQAVDWFDIDGVGKSPARFDIDRLTSLNGHYMRQAEPRELVGLVLPRLEEVLGRELDETARQRLIKGMPGLMERAKTLVELAEKAMFYARSRPLTMSGKADRLLDLEARRRLARLYPALTHSEDWTAAAVEDVVRRFGEDEGIELGALAQPLRAALTGDTASPSLFEVMDALGREETLGRLDDVLAGDRPT